MAKNITALRKVPEQMVCFRPKAKKSFLLMIVVWSLYFLLLIGALYWTHIGNQRIMALFQQSPLCDRNIQIQFQDNCHDEFTAAVNQISVIYTGWGTNRYGGSSLNGHKAAVISLEFVMPDGSIVNTRINKQADYQNQVDQGNNLWMYLDQLERIQKGDNLTVSQWNGKVISIKTQESPSIYTLDHPQNRLKSQTQMIQAIFGMLFILLLVWSGYEIIRKPKR